MDIEISMKNTKKELLDIIGDLKKKMPAKLLQAHLIDHRIFY